MAEDPELKDDIIDPPKLQGVADIDIATIMRSSRERGRKGLPAGRVFRKKESLTRRNRVYPPSRCLYARLE